MNSTSETRGKSLRTSIMGLFIGICLLIATVSACGSGSSQETYSSSSLYSNWIKVDKSLLVEPLPAVTVSAGSTDANQNAALTAQNPDANANEKTADAGTAAVYKANIQNSGAGVSGFIVKFSPQSATTQGFNHFAYSLSNYGDLLMSKQKLALAKNFQTAIDPASMKSQLGACAEQLGQQLCTKGSRVAF